MSWRDRFSAVAKFRGVAFYVEATDRTGGRRGPDHEYPFNEDPPFSEDLGAEGRVFPVEGYVLGDEYLTARDALISALETPGVGELVHPTYGTRKVIARRFRVQERMSEGGSAKFSIEFHESSTKPQQPAGRTDGKGAVQSSVTAAKTSIGAQFLAAYNQYATRRDSVIGSLHGVSSKIDSITGRFSMETQATAEISRQAEEIRSSASALSRSGENLLSAQVSMISGLADGLIASQADPVRALLGLYDFDPGTRPSGSSAGVLAAQANFDALRRLVRRSVVAEAARAAITMTFESYEDAALTRNRILDLIDDLAEEAADDTYPAFCALRAALVAAVPGEGSDLPHLVTHVPPVTLPSLVLSHQLYGDLNHEADIVARNRVPHPLFIVAGAELEVLTRE